MNPLNILKRPDGNGFSRENLTAVITAIITLYNLVIAPRAGLAAPSFEETAAVISVGAAVWAWFNRSRGGNTK